MPRGDQTGPMGQGPRTGRGAGFCNGAATPGFTTVPGGGAMAGRGRGGGGGGRRGWRNMFSATGLTGSQQATVAEPVAEPPSARTEPSIEQELTSLQAQAAEAAANLDQIRRRIDEIAAATSQKSNE